MNKKINRRERKEKEREYQKRKDNEQKEWEELQIRQRRDLDRRKDDLSRSQDGKRERDKQQREFQDPKSDFSNGNQKAKKNLVYIEKGRKKECGIDNNETLDIIEVLFITQIYLIGVHNQIRQCLYSLTK